MSKNRKQQGFLSDRQWKRLIRDIKNQRCVLMLGPRMGGVNRSDNWYPLVEDFSRYLTKELDQEQIPYDELEVKNLPYTAQCFLSIDGVKRIDLEDEIVSYYQQHSKEIPEIYNQLAKLPFPIIIDATFERYIAQSFENIGKLCQEGFYNFRRKVTKEINWREFTYQAPLVYKLFGSLEKPESLVITDEEQLEFIRNVIKDDPGFPDEVLEQFNHNKSYLFLGFNLMHWQFRLLLEYLNLKESNQTHAPQTKGYNVDATTKNTFERRFKFLFIDKDAPEFLKELRQRLDTEELEKPIEKKSKKRIFISYSDQDEDYVRLLCNFMGPMQDNGEVELLHKMQISPGVDRNKATEQMINQADVILFMLSSYFLADQGIKDFEFPLSIAKNHDDSCRLIPIITRACDWQSLSGLNQLIPLPANGVSLTSTSWETQDDAYLKVIKSLKKLIW